MSTSFRAANFAWPISGIPFPVVLTLDRDAHRQLYLSAISFDEGYPEPWGTVSVVPHDGRHIELCDEPDTFFVKTYNENDGVLEALIEQGYVTPTGKSVQPMTSFVEFPQVRLTDKGRSLNPTLFRPA